VNVIGVLKGTKTNWDGQAVLVTAHYDHLGRGWPEAHAENAGKLHPGADDNASGVAVLLELARVFASTDRPQRSIVFVAFTGEEAGLVGSRYFVDHPRSVALDKIEGVINLDTVGRLGSGKISVLGAGTATEWPPVFRGIGFVSGIESATVAGNETASDQRAFIERGVPAVQIFTGPHADYHRPGDTADKIDAAGLVKVATVAKEAVAYLAERPTPLTVTIAAATGSASTTPPAQPAPAAQGRRVSFGAVPDFTFQGTGVKLSDVTAGSPAAQAGLQAGDVIAKIDGTPTPSLQAFSDKLRSLQPGQKVTVTFVRGGTEQSLDVTVAAR
jgi:Zn-dependent M28 family amino/carboxypeptidase